VKKEKWHGMEKTSLRCVGITDLHHGGEGHSNRSILPNSSFVYSVGKVERKTSKQMSEGKIVVGRAMFLGLKVAWVGCAGPSLLLFLLSLQNYLLFCTFPYHSLFLTLWFCHIYLTF
jgi:hypothetical protein